MERKPLSPPLKSAGGTEPREAELGAPKRGPARADHRGGLAEPGRNQAEEGGGGGEEAAGAGGELRGRGREPQVNAQTRGIGQWAGSPYAVTHRVTNENSTLVTDSAG